MGKTVILITLYLLLTGCGRLITPAPLAVGPQLNTPTPELNITPRSTVTARPTSTPRPATPSATPTPTVTPTPIIYAVQPGDTLLSIAINFGVPVESIQTANGIIDPRTLQINQILVIPEPQEETDGQPTPTPTPFPANVRGVSFQLTPQGSLWAFGEVYNPGQDTLSEIVVEISLFDAEGKLLASESVFTQLDLLLPEQGVPFAILYQDPPTSFAQYQATVISAVPIYGETRYYLDIAPIETSATPVDEATYRVSGQLENVGSENIEAIYVVAIAYDASNKVLAQRQATLDVVLLRSHARTPFQIDLTLPPAVTVDHYVVQAQGLRAP